MSSEPDTTLRITADLLRFRHNPFHNEDALELLQEHTVVVQNGHIQATVPREVAARQWPDAPESHHPGHWLLPGFIDAHSHYPQLGIVASWGEALLPWLERYTFPEEARFRQPDYAESIADRYQRLCLKNGITTPVVFCTSHPHSVEAWFRQAQRRNMRTIAGQVLMNRNAPDAVLRDHEAALLEVEQQIQRWHDRGRQQYALTPRFAATSTPEQLRDTGQLMQHTGCLMQTHLSENREEIRWMLNLFPGCRDYLDIYQQHGLLGTGSLFAHGIHLSDSEIKRMHRAGAKLVHCPTSNLFLGSGLMPTRTLADRGITLALGSDIGAGPTLNPFALMARAYEISRLQNRPLTAAQLLWMATGSAAQALGLANHIGALEPGKEADVILIDPHAHELLASRMERAETLEAKLFALICLSESPPVRKTWLAGQPA